MEETDSTHLAILNGEFNEDYAQFLAESFDEGYTAVHFLKAFVKRVRELGDWERLAQHRHRVQLTRHWLIELLLYDPDQLNPAEVLLAFNCGLKYAEEQAWHLVARKWHVSCIRPLERSICSDDTSREARRAALGCLVIHKTELLHRLIVRLRQDRKFARLVEIAYDIAEWMKRGARPNTEPTETAASRAKSLLPDDMLGVADACLALHQKTEPRISDEAQALLQQASGGCVDVRLIRGVIGRIRAIRCRGVCSLAAH